MKRFLYITFLIIFYVSNLYGQSSNQGDNKPGILGIFDIADDLSDKETKRPDKDAIIDAFQKWGHDIVSPDFTNIDSAKAGIDLIRESLSLLAKNHNTITVVIHAHGGINYNGEQTIQLNKQKEITVTASELIDVVNSYKKYYSTFMTSCRGETSIMNIYKKLPVGSQFVTLSGYMELTNDTPFQDFIKSLSRNPRFDVPLTAGNLLKAYLAFRGVDSDNKLMVDNDPFLAIGGKGYLQLKTVLKDIYDRRAKKSLKVIAPRYAIIEKSDPLNKDLSQCWTVKLPPEERNFLSETQELNNIIDGKDERSFSQIDNNRVDKSNLLGQMFCKDKLCDLALVDRCLKNGFNPNMIMEEGTNNRYPLHYLIEKKDYAAVKKFIEAGASGVATGEPFLMMEGTALDAAIDQGDLKMVQTILDADKKIDLQRRMSQNDIGYYTCRAARAGSIPILEYMKSKKAPFGTNYMGHTAYSITESEEVRKWLVDNKIDPNPETLYALIKHCASDQLTNKYKMMLQENNIAIDNQIVDSMKKNRFCDKSYYKSKTDSIPSTVKVNLDSLKK
ncbi:MAG: hypothetical protein WCQ47_02770 [bacterium]